VANVHVLLLEVDVGEVETDRLGATEAGGVDELDERAVPEGERPFARRGAFGSRRPRRGASRASGTREAPSE
jgi:hypothetical protein